MKMHNASIFVAIVVIAICGCDDERNQKKTN